MGGFILDGFLWLVWSTVFTYFLFVEDSIIMADFEDKDPRVEELPDEVKIKSFNRSSRSYDLIVRIQTTSCRSWLMMAQRNNWKRKR